MKRLQTLCVCLTVVGLAACGGDDSGGDGTVAPLATDAPTISTSATEAPTATDAPGATDAPVATEASVVTEAPATVPADLPEIDDQGRVLYSQTVAQFVLNTAVAYGERGFDPYVLADAVADVYPSLSVDGSAMDATPTDISIASVTVDDKSLPGADNPYIVAVAALDTQGVCTAIAVYGYPTLDQQFTGDGSESCTADAVVDALRTQLGG